MNSLQSLLTCMIAFLCMTSCVTDLTVVPSSYEPPDGGISLEVGELRVNLPGEDQDLRAQVIDRWAGKPFTPYNSVAFNRTIVYSILSLDLEASSDYQRSASQYAALTVYGEYLPSAHTGIIKPVYLEAEGWGNLEKIIRKAFPEGSPGGPLVEVDVSLWFDTFNTNRSMDNGPFDPVGTAFCIGQVIIRFSSSSKEGEKNLYAFADREFSTFKSTIPSEELSAELYREVLGILEGELENMLPTIATILELE